MEMSTKPEYQVRVRKGEKEWVPLIPAWTRNTDSIAYVITMLMKDLFFHSPPTCEEEAKELVRYFPTVVQIICRVGDKETVIPTDFEVFGEEIPLAKKPTLH